jgi:uncharacterized protein YggE
MNKKTLIFAALAVLAVVVSACGPATINQEAPAPLRTVSVTGSGQANLVPDIAYIYVGVHTEKPSAAESVAENNAQTQAMIQALKDFGIDTKDIRTTNFSIWPMDKFDPATGQPSGLKVYTVDNTVYITVRDLAKLGDLLDTVIAAGANTVNSVQFDVADKDAALKQARADAVKDAQSKAQELAGVAGLALGEIQSISFNESPIYPVMEGRGGGGAAAEAPAVPIQPGQLTFSVTVNVSYAIK